MDRCARRASARTAPRSACRPPRAMCSGPVSPEPSGARPLRDREEVGDAASPAPASAAPPDAATTAAASRLLARPPQHQRRSPRRSRMAAASAPKRSAGHRLFGHAAPGLISSVAARRQSAPRRRPRRATGISSGNADVASSHCRAARSSAEVLVNDVRGVAGIDASAYRRARQSARAGARREIRSSAAHRPRAPAPPTSAGPADRSPRRTRRAAQAGAPMRDQRPPAVARVARR